jgi:hypothetical protein
MKIPKVDVLVRRRFWPNSSRSGRKPEVLFRGAGALVQEESNGYLHTDGLDGAFALSRLAQAAESCLGSDQWPGNLPVP